jgi:hypothetical protein
MFDYYRLKPALLGLVVLAGMIPSAMAAAPDAVAPQASAAAQSQGTARVWFLRPTSSANPLVWGASPMIYANGQPIAAISPNSSFYRDLPAGTYSFTVQPYGYPTGAANTLQLAPGSQAYLEIQWVPTWEMGYASGGRGDQSHAFFVLNMAPQLAQAYLPNLTDLGQR